MAELKRWLVANKMYAGLFFILIFIALIDTQQIKTFFKLDSQEAWSLYNMHTLPSFIALWIIIIFVPVLVYYLFSRDKSEAIGLAAAGLILLFSGTEDVLYFAASGQEMTPCMQWFNDLNAPVAYWSSRILNEECVSPFSLVSFALIGIVVSYFIFKKLQIAKW